MVSPRSITADPSITMVWFVPVIYTSHGATSIKIQSPSTHSYPSAQSTAAQGSESSQEAVNAYSANEPLVNSIPPVTNSHSDVSIMK